MLKYSLISRAVSRTRDGRHAICGERLPLGALPRARTRHRKVKVAVHAEGDGTLRGLEVLGHVGIEVVLTVEHRVALNLAEIGRAHV